MADPNASPPPVPPAPNDPPPSVPAASPISANAAGVPLVRPDAPPIFQGSVSHWMAFKSYLVAVLVLLAGVALLIFGSADYYTHWVKNGPSWLPSASIIVGLAAILASGIMILYVRARVTSHRYTITYRLIERETGIIKKTVDALDLGRVKHVDMTQTFVERMINVGTIEVYTGDSEEPKLLIEDIPNARPVYEKLRDAVIDLSRRRGIIIEYRKVLSAEC